MLVKLAKDTFGITARETTEAARQERLTNPPRDQVDTEVDELLNRQVSIGGQSVTIMSLFPQGAEITGRTYDHFYEPPFGDMVNLDWPTVTISFTDAQGRQGTANLAFWRGDNGRYNLREFGLACTYENEFAATAQADYDSQEYVIKTAAGEFRAPLLNLLNIPVGSKIPEILDAVATKTLIRSALEKGVLRNADGSFVFPPYSATAISADYDTQEIVFKTAKGDFRAPIDTINSTRIGAIVVNYSTRDALESSEPLGLLENWEVTRLLDVSCDAGTLKGPDGKAFVPAFSVFDQDARGRFVKIIADKNVEVGTGRCTNDRAGHRATNRKSNEDSVPVLASLLRELFTIEKGGVPAPTLRAA